MYTPSAFSPPETTQLLELIASYPFGLLVCSGDIGVQASHVPFHIISRGPELRLFTHLAAQNPQCQALESCTEALAVFQGPHAYISPSWYSHPNVPTWNYVAVQARASVRPLPWQETLPLLQALTASYEPDSERYSLHNLPPNMLDKMGQQLRGYELRVHSLEGSWKLSQNRSAQDFAHIITQLESSTDAQAQETARFMRVAKPVDAEKS